jgi:hypothetical protein
MIPGLHQHLQLQLQLLLLILMFAFERFPKEDPEGFQPWPNDGFQKSFPEGSQGRPFLFVSSSG